MDEIVKQAMAKWPNVPYCYGWLMLDARGAWRMRDERAQALGQTGDKLFHSALIGFINRNYQHDDQGRWYFQNGPQRVYVNLEATPYIARTDSASGFVLHTGTPLTTIEQVWLTDIGELLLVSQQIVAQVDDRDMAHCIPALHFNNQTVSDEQLLAWLAHPDDAVQLTLSHAGQQLRVQHIAKKDVPEYFRFIRAPQPDSH
jgi:hypothetical protein